MDVGDHGAAAKVVMKRFGGGGDILWISWSRNNCDETLFRRLLSDIPENWRFVNAHTLAQRLWPARGQMTEAEAAAQTCAAHIVFPSRQLRVVAAKLCPTKQYDFHMPDHDARAILDIWLRIRDRVKDIMPFGRLAWSRVEASKWPEPQQL
ncbi:hypothetical protein BDZ88DRAFT_448617 [Geranomyces variabilis]|nr:hypothetical protein BDZ88DRAFT_448617 [Geranomyces variabilis]KAJ3134226.1 hypothetical protein HDU90_005323 [Geranomyces variabilis]